jgi:hypothetical protein
MDAVNTYMNTCFFCGNLPGEAPYTVEQPIYRLDGYAHLGLVRRFTFTKMIVPIKRCGVCAQRHRKSRKNRKTRIIVGAVLGFIIGLVIPGAFLFTAIIGGFCGYVSAKAKERKSFRRTGLKGLEPAALGRHPLVEEKINSGWRLKKP